MPMHTRFSVSSYCKFLTQSTILSSCFLVNYALADTLTFSPTAPGISVTGLSGDITTGYADILLPVVGQPTEFFYVDPQGLLHSSQDYSAALGLGARKLTDSLGILGAYVYGDYNHAPDGHGFWFVSPGIERFGDRIDFSANVYLPVGSTQVNSGTFFGDQAGIYDNVFFAGHNEYDVFYNSFEAVGTGVDAEVGYRLNNQGSGVANMNVDNVSVTSSQSLASFAAFSSTNFANGTINLVVNDSVFQNTTVGFTTANNQLGVFNLTFNNSFVSDCANGFSMANLGGGAAHLVMNNSRIEQNNFSGLNMFNDGGITTATLNSSGFNQNGINGVEAFNNAGSVYIVANRSSFNDNRDYGIQATNVTSIVNNGSTFSGNGLGPINP